MIELVNVALRLGAFQLTGVNLVVPRGAYAVVMGPTGCGKTSLIEVICGLRPIVAGEVRLRGADVTHHRPADRGIGYVPQDTALFATMTVRDNVAFAPRVRATPRGTIDRRVAELADLLGITHLLDRMPAGLSGGEAQRVALGRALAAEADILCLDEPLNALDDATKAAMCDLLRAVRAAAGVTVLHVTHDAGEAHALADVVYRFEGGGFRRVPMEPGRAAPGHPGPAGPE